MLSGKTRFLKVPAKKDLGICTEVFFAVDGCLFGCDVWRVFANQLAVGIVSFTLSISAIRMGIS